MSVVCDFEVAVEIHDGITATILGNLNDVANGLSVGVPLDDDDDRLERITTSSPFVKGDFEVIATPAAGRLELVLMVAGSTWVEAAHPLPRRPGVVAPGGVLPPRRHPRGGHPPLPRPTA